LPVLYQAAEGEQRFCQSRPCLTCQTSRACCSTDIGFQYQHQHDIQTEFSGCAYQLSSGSWRERIVIAFSVS
jgi:hypothetical protein